VTELDRAHLARLAATLKAGTDQEAWQALAEVLQLIGPAAEARLRAYHLDRESIDDVLAQSALELFQRRKRIDPERSLAGYFLATARSKGIRLLAVRARAEQLDESQIASRSTPSAEQADLRRAESQTGVDRALAEMDDIDAAILRAYAAASDDRAWTAAVARELGLDANAVRVRKHRALRKLAALLDAVDPRPRRSGQD